MNISKMIKSFLIAFVVVFFSISETVAGDQFKDFGSFSLKVHYPDNHKSVEIKEKKELKIGGLEYLAINYYEGLPQEKGIGMLNVAVLKKDKRRYITLFEKNVFNIGPPYIFDSPFLFSTNGNQFIFFQIRGGAGHNVSFFIVKISNDTVREITLEDDYTNLLIKSLLQPGEETFCRGPQYDFKGGRITGVLNVYKRDDPCCCPTGGEILFSYKFENDSFKIKNAKRFKN